MPRKEENVLARDGAQAGLDEGRGPPPSEVAASRAGDPGAACVARAVAGALAISAEEGVKGTSMGADGVGALSEAGSNGLIAPPPSLLEWCSARSPPAPP